MEESFWTKRAKTLTQWCIVSGVVNVALGAALVYQKMDSSKAAKRERAAQLQQGFFSQLSQMNFQELVEKFQDTRPLEDGLAVRHLALSILAHTHHFDIHRALPGVLFQKRTWQALPDLIAFTGLTDDHFQALTFFAQREKWPLTVEGLFLKLKSDQDPPASLKEAFYLTSEFQKAYTLFNREGSKMDKEEVLALLKSGTFDMLSTLFADCDFSRETRLAILERYHYSPKAVSPSVREEQKVPLVAAVETKQRVHVVGQGDTLWKIARVYKVDMQTLIKRNKLEPNKPLRPGQQLFID